MLEGLALNIYATGKTYVHTVELSYTQKPQTDFWKQSLAYTN